MTTTVWRVSAGSVQIQRAPVTPSHVQAATSAETVAAPWSAQIDAMLRESRQRLFGQLGGAARQHREHHAAAYNEDVREGMSRNDDELLDDLATKFGLAWVDLSRMVGVSVPAIRKWRLSGGVSAENHEKLAQVWALLRSLERVAGVSDPVVWLSKRLEPGFTVTPRHVWAPQHTGVLIDMAMGNTKNHVGLDLIDPDWRNKYETRDEVVMLDDGSPAIVRRG